MKTVSILNHVLGPVMRGPSSSHTAGAFHIGSMARSMLGGTPRRAVLAFDPGGSYAATYAEQGADRGFAMGLMGRPLTDESFFTALGDAPSAGMEILFEVRPLDRADHPNTVDIELTSADGEKLTLVARSIGGGEVEIVRVDGREVLFNGSACEAMVEAPTEKAEIARGMLMGDGECLDIWDDSQTRASVLAQGTRTEEERHGLEAHGTNEEKTRAGRPCHINHPHPGPLPGGEGEEGVGITGHVRWMVRRKAPVAGALRDIARVWESAPVYFVQKGRPLFASAAEIMRMAEERHLSLGRLALAYEAQLLGISEAEVMAEMLRRYDIMAQSVQRGLARDFVGLQLLPACAGSIFEAEAAEKLSTRSLHTRAAARAMAVMHVDGAMGVVCAAPTGGSAGVIPGTLVTLAEERSMTREQIGLALLAAGAIGLIVAQRATFAAEVAGCQVEIGASGAMAAAAVVDAVGGTAQQACNAAAISFQNTMGSVCDLLHGIVEIPCHTRNAVAAANAFVNADLVLGGYVNFIPLDETIDAVYAVGLAMPAELRCTSRGGLAIAPSAKAMKPGCCPSTCSKYL